MTEEPLSAAQLERIHKAFEQVPFVHLLGIGLDAVERGAATLFLEVRDELKQNRGLLHGGVTASLVDTAAAFAILTLLEPTESTATVDLTIHYLRPITEGRISAQARVARNGRKIVVISVDVFDSQNRQVATTITTYAKIESPA